MDTTEIGTLVMILTTVGIVYLIWKLRQRNVSNMEEEPIIAGSDELAGAAIDPTQFDEPDDSALDEMQDLLEKSAESQGLTYDE
ncbi:MAG: hypothetical protein VX320_06660 [Candidatus Thermoplasmatota archaeon]|nr:hypothetical protein [Candidatus Thermoplasmatota archaeon]